MIRYSYWTLNLAFNAKSVTVRHFLLPNRTSFDRT